MKKIIIHTLFAFLLLSAQNGFAQQSNVDDDLDFFIQLQNSNNHDAIIYPNPTYNYAFKIIANAVVKDVEVVNIIGQKIFRYENKSLITGELLIEMGKCEKGMYLVKINFEDNKTIIKKLLVK